MMRQTSLGHLSDTSRQITQATITVAADAMHRKRLSSRPSALDDCDVKKAPNLLGYMQLADPVGFGSRIGTGFQLLAVAVVDVLWHSQ